MTILLLYLCLEGVEFIRKKKIWQGSLLIAFGVSVKIMPIVMLPYLFYRGQFKSVIIVIIATIGIMFLPSLIIGTDYNTELLKSRWELINPSNKEHVVDLSEESFHSLSSLLPALLIKDVGYSNKVGVRRNITDVSFESMSLILNIARGILVFLMLIVLSPGLFKSFRGDLQMLYELSYLFLITPLIFPHQQHYAFFMIMPAVGYLVFYYIIMYRNNCDAIPSKKISLYLFFGLIFLLLNSHFLIGAYRDYFDYFKTLTYGVLLLIPLLLVSKPRKLHLMISKNSK
jgi:hypothetical protein